MRIFLGVENIYIYFKFQCFIPGNSIECKKYFDYMQNKEKTSVLEHKYGRNDGLIFFPKSPETIVQTFIVFAFMKNSKTVFQLRPGTKIRQCHKE